MMSEKSIADENHEAKPTPEFQEMRLKSQAEEEEEEERRRRRWLLLLLLLLLFLLCCVCGLFARYLQKPEPLPEMVPVVNEVTAYPPHYLFSIYGLDGPVGVAVSPDGTRIYVAETRGERLIKVFDRDGNFLFSFAPPRTRPAERSPVYMMMDPVGRLFVSDRLQHAVYVYDGDGNYIDTILSPDLTLSEYVASQVGDLPAGTVFSYNIFQENVYYQKPGEEEKLLPAPERPAWSPLGIFLTEDGSLFLTDVIGEEHKVYYFASDVIMAPSWTTFDPPLLTFGTYGEGDGAFIFPNEALTDSQSRIYVSDGNNGRISVWDPEMNYVYSFGRGSGEGALNLPRGLDIDERDRLHIVDAVGQNVKVFNVSGEQPDFLYIFGDFGFGDGQFNYPNDIALDETGRLYIADRENNRVQVWSY